MHLLIRRGQRDDGWIWNSITFHLDVRLDLNAEERDLFDKYRLGSFVVYNSDAREHHADAAYAAFDDATKIPWDPSLSELAASLWSNTCGVARSVLMVLALRITYGDLVQGQHVECENLEAILAAEHAIAQACELLAAYLETALTFDGREDLHEYP